MNEENLIKYYNKFNEDKRLDTRHGQVEFITCINYINKYIKPNNKIIDIGAGTGKYSVYYKNKGYDVKAIELVKHNLNVIKQKGINAHLGNAINLNKEKDNTYDIVILFGPMYHLITKEEKIKALSEAKRIVKNDGYIFISYCLNDFAVLKHGFIDNHIKEEINNKKINDNFKITPSLNDLYSFVTLDEIDDLNKTLNLTRIELISEETQTEYIRRIINKMDEETFNLYIKYHLSICNKHEYLGFSRHVLDIVKK